MFDFKNDFKNAFTNVFALLGVVVSAVQVYVGTLGGGEINWFVLASTVIGSVVAFFTGRPSN